MNEKYRIVSLLDEIVINLRDFIFIITEKSSAHRDTDTFFIWHFLDLLWNEEKCYIINLRARNLECIQKSSTLLVSDNDKISFLKKLSEHHLIFNLFHFERNTEIDDRRTCKSSNLRTEIPLVEQIGK